MPKKSTAPKLDNTFRITINGEEKKIFMSFGLLDLCANTIGDLDQAAVASADNTMRGRLLTTLLSEYGDDGEISKKINLMTSDIAQDDVLNLLEWSQEHVMRFFIKSLTKAQEMTGRNMADLENLMSSVVGSPKT